MALSCLPASCEKRFNLLLWMQALGEQKVQWNPWQTSRGWTFSGRQVSWSCQANWRAPLWSHLTGRTNIGGCWYILLLEKWLIHSARVQEQVVNMVQLWKLGPHEESLEYYCHFWPIVISTSKLMKNLLSAGNYE